MGPARSGAASRNAGPARACRLHPHSHLPLGKRRASFGLWVPAMVATLWVTIGVAPLVAQRSVAQSGFFVGGELERYARSLQLAGRAEAYPWSIRGFSPSEVDRLLPADSAHPWGATVPLRGDAQAGLRFAAIAPQARLVYNSAFPYGYNDGAIWAGRGATAALSGGFLARYRAWSLVVAPTAFVAQNAVFPLTPNGLEGEGVLADGRFPNAIDLPQRFGTGAYGRVDPGQTTLRMDLPLLAAGVSTANQHWGPVREQPLILGSNAAGFPHLFLGSSRPTNVGIGSVHGRLVWGELTQSAYAPSQSVSERRFMSGVVGLFTPRGIPGLEIGGSRFFHSPWREGGFLKQNFGKPFEVFLKESLADSPAGDDGSDPDNQLASVFARWVFPSNGFELYGEFAREDHNFDLRDFLLQPDHISGYNLGFAKVWLRESSSMTILRGEVMNARVTHLVQVRLQVPFYVHHAMTQGHTQRGQILGAASGFGGASAGLWVDRYHPAGRWTLGWKRDLRQERALSPAEMEGGLDGADVMHSLAADALFVRGGFDLTAGAVGSYNLSRDFAADAFNLNLQLGIRIGL